MSSENIIKYDEYDAYNGTEEEEDLMCYDFTPFNRLCYNNLSYNRFSKKDSNVVEIISNQSSVPRRGTKDAAGYDFVYEGEEVIIKPQETKLISLNMKLALPKGTVMFLKTRSSFAKIGINVTGGVIDSDYRGNISVCILNSSNEDFKVDNNMKVCQGVLLKYETMIFKPVDTFSEETERGEKGFGSTGSHKQ
ncbi:putative deoxyuridine 5'-triphosphate nucleotidohydrolase [Yalta virus]|nr:putative deoxyuridine 5'-triphosphate nucleotidohydrolase [Yalta virus]